jgi:hypothetical protein
MQVYDPTTRIASRTPSEPKLTRLWPESTDAALADDDRGDAVSRPVGDPLPDGFVPRSFPILARHWFGLTLEG